MPSTLWLFAGMSLVISGTPGPNMLFVMVSSARHGLRLAVAAMLGCLTALVLMMGASAAGLGVLLQTFPSVLEILRLLGAAYLAYLGLQSWRAPTAAPAMPDHQLPPVTAPRFGRVWHQGFWVSASNPKAILFATAFFPQFIQAEQPKLPQFLVLLLTFALIEMSWYGVYALSGRQLALYLQRPAVMRSFNRLTGVAFVGFAALMLLSKK